MDASAPIFFTTGVDFAREKTNVNAFACVAPAVIASCALMIRLTTPFLLLALAGIYACGGAQSGAGDRQLSYGEDAQANYEEALEAYEDGHCLAAEPQFRRIRREFPYSSYAALSELGVSDCHLQMNQYSEAIQGYRRFIRFHPSHARVPYASFRIAQAFYDQIPSDWWLSPPAYERDLDASRRALQHLRRFVLRHSDDERVPEARDMIAQALGLLARHELYVARFYLDRGASSGAILRLRGLVTTYPGSAVEAEAMLLLGETLQEDDQSNDAREVFEQLRTRFPDSAEAGRAASHLRSLGDPASDPATEAES